MKRLCLMCLVCVLALCVDAFAADGEVAIAAYVPAPPKAPEGRPQYTCKRASGKITVDGDLAEWKDVSLITLDKPAQAHGTWKDAADLSGTARLCYDDQYLYLAFETTDDVFKHTFPLVPIWAGDCVQFAFDPLENREVEQRGADDQEMTVALTPEGARLARWAGPQGRGEITTAKLALKRKPDGGGVIYEIALPWDELTPLAPALRPSFGFTFSFNDYDERPEEAWLQWTPGIQNGKNPNAFGQVILEYSPPAGGETELYLTSVVSEEPNVTALAFPLFRRAAADEKLAVTMTLSAGEKPVASKTTEITLTKGEHTLAVVWTPTGVPDGTFAGTVSVVGPGGKAVARVFNYERLITAPLIERIDALVAGIGAAAKSSPAIYAKHEASLAYRMDVARMWLAGDGSVRNWRLLPKLVDDAESIVAGMLKGEDALAKQRGTLLLAYRAPEDDMPQPFRLEVPDDYDGTTDYPLIVLLHGYGGSDLTYDLWAGLSLGSESAPRAGHLVAVPYGRGNTGWRGWGRNDVWHVIERVKRDYRIDADRVYVSGFSMGGGGTWYLATHYPDRWAACSPRAGGLGRYDAPSAEEMKEWPQRLSAAGSSMLRLANLNNVPTGIFHGLADSTVSPKHSEEAFKRLRALEYEAAMTADVRTGHNMSRALKDGLDDWMLEHTRNAFPKEVVLATWDLRHNRAYWVEIDELIEDYASAEVRAKFVEPGKIDLRTVNVSRLTLTVPEVLMGDAKVLEIRAGDSTLRIDRLPADRTLHLATPNGGTIWMTTASQYRPGLVKKHGMSGPLDEAFGERFVIVYGTAGGASADAMMRSDAEACATRMKGLTSGRMWGNFPVKADVDVTPEDVRSANLILFGGPEVNAYAAKIANGLPVSSAGGKLTFRGKVYDDPQTAVRFIYPNPENPERTVVVTAAAMLDAYRNIDHSARSGPDWLLFDAESAKRRDENKRPTYADGGFFDRNWK